MRTPVVLAVAAALAACAPAAAPRVDAPPARVAYAATAAALFDAVLDVAAALRAQVGNATVSFAISGASRDTGVVTLERRTSTLYGTALAAISLRVRATGDASSELAWTASTISGQITDATVAYMAALVAELDARFKRAP